MSLSEGFDLVTQRDLKMFSSIIYIKKKWLKPGVVTGACKLSTQEAEYSVLSGTAASSRQPDLKDKSRWYKVRLYLKKSERMGTGIRKGGTS